MSVEYLDTPGFHGFRVRRQIDNTTYQEYFSLKDGGRPVRGAARTRVRRAAEARDAELASSQRDARERAAREVHFDDRGRVRGILYRRKKEKNGRITPLFQIGIHSAREDRLVNTTVSIWSHGLDEAWRRAVDFYAKHKQIPRHSSAYRQLLAAKPDYPELAERYGPVRSRHRSASASGVRAAPRPPVRAGVKTPAG